MSTTLIEDIRNLDARIVMNEKRVREDVLLFGAKMNELKEGVIARCDNLSKVQNNEFGREIDAMGLRTSKDLRADAMALARAVTSGFISRETALLLPAREVRALPSKMKKAAIELTADPQTAKLAAMAERSEGNENEAAVARTKLSNRTTAVGLSIDTYMELKPAAEEAIYRAEAKRVGEDTDSEFLETVLDNMDAAAMRAAILRIAAKVGYSKTLNAIVE